MIKILHVIVRLAILLALLSTSAFVLAHDDEASAADTSGYPFIGIRYWDTAEGLLVTGVIPNTPAKAVGLQSGDLVQALDDVAVRLSNIRDLLRHYAPGDNMTLAVERDGGQLAVDVTLMALPEDLFSNADYYMPLDTATIGLYLHQCGNHVYIIGALAGSEVAHAGFHHKDLLLSVNGEPVDSIGAADVTVSRLNEGDELAFTVKRGDRVMTMKLNVVDERKRRHPRQSPRPRLEINSAYATDAVSFGYGDSAIEIRELSSEHELYTAGLRQYDIITAANGAPLMEASNLFMQDAISLTVQRQSGTLHFDAPSSVAPLLMFGWTEAQEQDNAARLDLREKQVTLGVRYFQLEADSPYLQGHGLDNGAIVAEVIEGLPAADAGLRIGDIIVLVDGAPATREIDLRNRIYFHAPGRDHHAGCAARGRDAAV